MVICFKLITKIDNCEPGRNEDDSYVNSICGNNEDLIVVNRKTLKQDDKKILKLCNLIFVLHSQCNGTKADILDFLSILIVKYLRNLRTALVYKRKYTSPGSMLNSETFSGARRLKTTTGATQRQMKDRDKNKEQRKLF